MHDGRERAASTAAIRREVQPLVDDLNALLDHREQTVARALAKAGDLAHGLKTPLAVLAQEAERAAAAGHRRAGRRRSRQQVERMRRQIDYHLAHARAAASGADARRALLGRDVGGRARAHAAAAARRARARDRRRTSRRSRRPRPARGPRRDARQPARQRLQVGALARRRRARRSTTATIVITVDDDGPGLEPSMRDAVLQRGVRADEAAPGSGLGLAIVRDLAELYGGSIALDASPLGGVRARLHLPPGTGRQYTSRRTNGSSANSSSSVMDPDGALDLVLARVLAHHLEYVYAESLISTVRRPGGATETRGRTRRSGLRTRPRAS